MALVSARIALVLLALAAFSVGGCQIAPIVHLANGSGHDVVVIVGDQEEAHRLLASGEVEFVYPYTALSIEFGSCRLFYSPPAPPMQRDFFRYRGARAHFNLRVGPDFAISMLTPEKGGVAAPLLQPQPDGFPLVPARRVGCHYGF